ncbi:MAG: PAS domain S-box protein [Chloroflexi bacterium]|nr:PAS domain S-box protein [Chloroflexota bacterium]
MIDDQNTAYLLDRLGQLSRQRDALPAYQIDILENLLDLIQLGLNETERRTAQSERCAQALADATAGLHLAQIGQWQGSSFEVASFVTDTQGIIRRSNRAAGALLQQQPSHFVGHEIKDLVKEDQRATFSDILAQIAAGEQIIHEGESVLITTNGEDVEVVFTVFSLRNGPAGKLVGIRWLFQRPVHEGINQDELFDTQERLRATFAQSAVGMAHLTLDGRWERANERLCDLTGYSEEELVNMTLADVLHPDDLREDEAYSQQLLAGLITTYTLELRYLQAESGLIWARQTASLLSDRNGQPQRRILVVEDITDRKRVQSDLVAALHRTHQLYAISRYIAQSNTHEEILKALMGADELRNVHRALAIGFEQPWEDTPPESLDTLAEWWRQAQENLGASASYPFGQLGYEPFFLRNETVIISNVGLDNRIDSDLGAFLEKAGTQSLLVFPLVANRLWFGTLIFFFDEVFSSDDDKLRYITSIVDLAAIALFNQRLFTLEAQARRDAEVADDLKLKFLAVISHELRTPLASIKGFASTLLAQDVTWSAESQRDFIQTIDEEADKLSELISQLLDLSRLEAGTLAMSLEAIAPGDVLKMAEPELRILARNHQLTVELSDDLPMMMADTQRLAQVLANLVNNSTRYSTPGTQISIKVDMVDTDVVFSVSDQGVGIPPEVQQSIFQPFNRSTDIASERGIGLGLAISQGIVERHGGRIWVAESSKAGTTIRFAIPNVQSANQERP